jgi:hypothetical protein
MPHPEPERRTNEPPGTSLLAGLTPEQAQAVTHDAVGEALRSYADEVLVCEGNLISKTQAELRSLHLRRDRDGLQS